MLKVCARLTAVVILAFGLLSAAPAHAASKPPAPTGITISPTTDSATITWKASAGADYYALCLVTYSKATRCSHASPRVTDTTYTFDDLVPTYGTDYYVRIRATNTAGGTNSPRIAFNLKDKPRTAPPAPTDITIDPGYDSATITWSPASGADYYALCLVTSARSTRCSHASPRVYGTTYTFDDLTPTGGTDYYVRVRANNAYGGANSPRIPFDLTPDPRPDPATGLSHRVIGYDAVEVDWDPVDQATSYRVCLLEVMASSSCSHSATTTSTSARLDDIAPTSGRDWYYRIETTAGRYTSLSALGGFDLPVSGVPSVKSVPVEVGRTKAWWHSARNAETYEIQFALNTQMKSGQQDFTSEVTNVEMTSLTPGRPYWFRVRGINGPEVGAWSDLGQVRPAWGPGDVTVLTYNLCGQDKCVTSTNKMAKWNPTRKRLAGSYVRGTDSGIIATQESHSKDTNFGTELPGYKLASYYSAKSLHYDTALYSRERAGIITLSSRDRKYAVWGQFRAWATGTRFFVVNAHLQPYKGKYNDDKRAAQTRVLIREIAEANDEDLPVVYAGDYNSNKSNADQSRYKNGYDAPLAVFRDAGIPDTIDIVDPANSFYEDWNSANQAKNPPLRHSDHVDHIFADPEIDVLEWRVMLRASGGQYSVPFASDHNPVRATLRIPGS